MTRFRAQIREVINRNTVVSLAMEKGFNAYLPVYEPPSQSRSGLVPQPRDTTTHPQRPQSPAIKD